jgi:predicted phage tail component-like protein
MSNGLTFKSLYSGTFGLYVLSDNRQIFPDVTRFVKTGIPGVPGSIDFGNDTLKEQTLTINARLDFGTDLPTYRAQLEQIGGWLYDDGNYYELMFDDYPNRYYKAKFVSALPISQNITYTDLVLTFTCNPPYPYSLNNVPVSPADVQQRLLWDTATLDPSGAQYVQDFPADGPMRFTVSGSLAVNPVITLLGYIPAGLTLTCGTQVWRITQTVQYDGVIIDCNQQTVERASDGTNLFPDVDPDNDTFFTLQPGQDEIDISGSGGPWPDDLTVIVAFVPINV